MGTSGHNLSVDDLDEYRTIVVALIGPPASGKSTIAEMVSEMGVPSTDTGEVVRDKTHSRLQDTDDVTEDDYWETAQLLREEHGDGAPTCLLGDWITDQRADGNDVICISSLRNEAEVEWLREHVGPTIVIRIQTKIIDRVRRYADQRIDSDEPVSAEREAELRREAWQREQREKPYPTADLHLANNNSHDYSTTYRRVKHLIDICQA